MEIKIIYSIAVVVSLLVIIGYCSLIRKRDLWFVLLYSSVFIANTGYLSMSLSTTLGEALLANRLAYLGSVFLPLSLLMIIMNVCRYRYGKWIPAFLTGVSFVVFLTASSGGYLDLYYSDVSLVFANGAAKLLKEYGPLHIIYYIYLLSYFAAMAAIILYALIMKRVFHVKHAVLLLCAVFGNLGVWLIEQLVPADFEFLSISYIITELFLLFLYALLQDYCAIGDTDDDKTNEDSGYPDFEKLMSYCPELYDLTPREIDVLEAILKDKKRKEIAQELNVTEHTIKKHTSHIFSKMEVSSRKELYKKIGYRP